jgi:hypothetical protein
LEVAIGSSAFAILAVGLSTDSGILKNWERWYYVRDLWLSVENSERFEGDTLVDLAVVEQFVELAEVGQQTLARFGAGLWRLELFGVEKWMLAAVVWRPLLEAQYGQIENAPKVP